MKYFARTITTLLLLSQTLVAGTLPGFDRNASTLDQQRSPSNFVHIEDAYVSYKYVGGYILVVTFSIPNLDYNKQFYLLKNAQTNDSVYATFSRSFDQFKYEINKTLWIGNHNGRDRFVMKISNAQPNGPYTIYAKVAGRNIPGTFTLKPVK